MEEDLEAAEAVVEAAFESVAFAVVDKDVACVNLANQKNHNKTYSRKNRQYLI